MSREFYKCPYCGQTYVYDFDDIPFGEPYQCIISCEVCNRDFFGIDTFFRCLACHSRKTYCLSMPLVEPYKIIDNV